MDDGRYYSRPHCRIEFRPREFWLGLRWRRSDVFDRGRFFGCTDVWLQMVPCVAVHVWWFDGFAAHRGNGKKPRPAPRGAN